MCGRFTLTQSATAIADHFELDDLPILAPRYNIAPTQPVAVIRAGSGRQSSGDRQFHASSLGANSSLGERSSDGRKVDQCQSRDFGGKTVVSIGFQISSLPDSDGWILRMAADRAKEAALSVWLSRSPTFRFCWAMEHWQNADGSEIESCTIITTAANSLMRSIHDRMPVILQPQDYQQWLDPSVQKGDQIQSLLRPYEPSSDLSALTAYPVSVKVNNPRHDSPDCIEPIEGVELQPIAASPQNSQ